MTEAAAATAEKAPRKPESKANGAKKKERKSRASAVAVSFAQRIENAAAAKIDAEASDLYSKIEDAVINAASALVDNTNPETVKAILTLAVGAHVGVSKLTIAAARNTIQPVLAEAMLANVVG